MHRSKLYTATMTVAVLGFSLSLIVSGKANAHCDTVNGPVVTAAKHALESGDVTPVLKWVEPAYEGEVRQAFTRTMHVRSKDSESQELADQFFFETLVRLHRLGEGVAYTGLKPAGQDIEPGIEEADAALERGSDEQLISDIQRAAGAEIHKRFVLAVETKARADESVEAGRAFVAAYVDFIHFVEGIHQTLAAHASHAGHQEGEPPAHNLEATEHSDSKQPASSAPPRVPGENPHKH